MRAPHLGDHEHDADDGHARERRGPADRGRGTGRAGRPPVDPDGGTSVVGPVPGSDRSTSSAVGSRLPATSATGTATAAATARWAAVGTPAARLAVPARVATVMPMLHAAQPLRIGRPIRLLGADCAVAFMETSAPGSPRPPRRSPRRGEPCRGPRPATPRRGGRRPRRGRPPRGRRGEQRAERLHRGDGDAAEQHAQSP